MTGFGVHPGDDTFEVRNAGDEFSEFRFGFGMGHQVLDGVEAGTEEMRRYALKNGMYAYRSLMA